MAIASTMDRVLSKSPLEQLLFKWPVGECFNVSQTQHRWWPQPVAVSFVYCEDKYCLDRRWRLQHQPEFTRFQWLSMILWSPSGTRESKQIQLRTVEPVMDSWEGYQIGTSKCEGLFSRISSKSECIWLAVLCFFLDMILSDRGIRL